MAETSVASTSSGKTSVASTSSGNRYPPEDLLSGNERTEYLEICVPLYEATLTGDWDAAKRILYNNGKLDVVLVRKRITNNLETVLHVAAMTNRTDFVKELVEMMTPEDLQLQNKNENTALCLAAASGNLDIAKIMVEKDRDLLKIRGSRGMTPLYMAALFGHESMVEYFYRMSDHLRKGDWTDNDRVSIVRACVEAEFYDVALEILEHEPETARAEYEEVLHVLARKPSAFTEKKQPKFIDSIKQLLRGGHVKKKTQAIEIVKIIWKEVAKLTNDDISKKMRGSYSVPIKCPDINCPYIAGKGSEKCKLRCEEGILRTWPYRLLFVATEMGNIRFVTELIRIYPDLIWKIDDYGRTIFHTAVLHRQESIYNLLYEIGSIKDLITPQRDVQDNLMLHCAAMKPKQNRLAIVSGVALQVQRELLWFEEVESMVHPSYSEKKNIDGKTPRELFTEQHKDLVSKGEEWMKNTASQCMVVAALIATIVFAAAFTLPGGNDTNLGTPIFLNKSSFRVFVISDAISLFSSSTSILVFLSILTSRYAEQDFKESLPNKLMIGLTTLFFSIVTMMIAFSSSFFPAYRHGLLWAPILITVFAAIPVILFAGLHYRLLADVINSTYGSRYLFRPKIRMLYKQNPNSSSFLRRVLLYCQTILAMQNTTSDAQNPNSSSFLRRVLLYCQTISSKENTTSVAELEMQNITSDAERV